MGVHRRDGGRALQAELHAALSWTRWVSGTVLLYKGKAGLGKVEWLAQGDGDQTLSFLIWCAAHCPHCFLGLLSSTHSSSRKAQDVSWASVPF